MNKLILVDFDKREVRFVNPEDIAPKPASELEFENQPWAHCCKSHRHASHTFIPWAYKKPYDKHCDICDQPAAWVAGNGIPLCDCHVEDWSMWNNQDGRIHAAHSVKKVWMDCYRDFKKDVQSGKFMPDIRQAVNP